MRVLGETFQIEIRGANERLDQALLRALRERAPDFRRAKLKEWLSAGRVRIGDRRVVGAETLAIAAAFRDGVRD